MASFAFVFPGQGSQSVGMLDASQPRFMDIDRLLNELRALPRG